MKKGIYWSEKVWVQEKVRQIIKKSQDITGERLLDYVCEELNKLDGTMVEVRIVKLGEISSKSVIVFIATKTKIYAYTLNSDNEHSVSCDFICTFSPMYNECPIDVCELLFGEDIKTRNEALVKDCEHTNKEYLEYGFYVQEYILENK